MHHGVLNLLKPPGMTSHDAVAHVRRVLKTKRVGHTGTLDPAASGVLVICVGQATRLVETLQEGTKEYLAEATFGYETDTLDAVGQTLIECDATEIDASELERVCAQFRGSIQQRPPMYSAIKVGGQKLYDLAREGTEIDVMTRLVDISRLDVTRFSAGARPRALLRVQCSSGTYIRSLVRDVGRALNNAATMTFLSRVNNCGFALENSVTPREFEELPRLLSLPNVLSRSFGAIRVDNEAVHAFWQGKRVNPNSDPVENSPFTVWSNEESNLFALTSKDIDGQWKPEKVFDLRLG